MNLLDDFLAGIFGIQGIFQKTEAYFQQMAFIRGDQAKKRLIITCQCLRYEVIFTQGATLHHFYRGLFPLLLFKTKAFEKVLQIKQYHKTGF